MEYQFINSILKGDISKYTYFVEKYKNMAFTISFRILDNTEDAEEVVQDSFLKAYKALSKFRYDSKFSTWFYKIVVNTSLSRIKRKKLHTESIDPDNASESFIENVENIYKNLTQDEQKEFINYALQKLEIEDRMLITLYYLNENSLDEISEITHIPYENIKMKLHRARKKMYIVLNNKLKSEIQYLL
jgi:RNA polymerase sigma-70 factor (ECF subfamily)